jgi:hypothetical protein
MKCIFCPTIIEDNQKPVGSICRECFENMMWCRNGWKEIKLE